LERWPDATRGETTVATERNDGMRKGGNTRDDRRRGKAKRGRRRRAKTGGETERRKRTMERGSAYASEEKILS